MQVAATNKYRNVTVLLVLGLIYVYRRLMMQLSDPHLFNNKMLDLFLPNNNKMDLI